ncbi:MAG: hypothetical protein IKH77_04935 [Clostridia bacterium]|nr:hypothetical protein [Clostridia bacterium]
MSETVRTIDLQGEPAKKRRHIRQPKEHKPTAIGRGLNKFFHHIDRGSTTGREIAAGILLCFLGVCGMFMNMQALARFFMTEGLGTAEMGEAYASFYFLSMIAAFAGSMLMGLAARLPLIQIGSLGLSTVLISSLGIGSGLSYANLLAVCFVSSLVFTLISAVPPVRRAVLNAIPRSVRRAMPVAIGLLIAFIALQLTGLVQIGSSNLRVYGAGTVLNTAKIQKAVPTASFQSAAQTGSLFNFRAYNAVGYKGDSYFPLLQVCLIAAVAVFAAYALLHKKKHAMGWSFLIGTLVYFGGYLGSVVFYFTKNGALQFELDSLWARLWMVGSEDAMHLHLPAVLSNLNIGGLLKEGFDFTAYTEAGGSVALLMATGILTNLGLMLASADAAITAAADTEEAQKGAGLAMICSGAVNVLAPLFGMPAQSVSPLSVAGKKDGARSGLASAVAALGFLVSAFVWLVPFFCATTTSYDVQFNLYGHYGVVLTMLTDNSFIVADAVMILAGLYMAVTAEKPDFSLGREVIPYAAAVIVSLALTNPAMGLAAGIAAHLLANLFDRDRELSLGNILAAVPAVALIVLYVMK